MRCTCGYENPASARFCRKCGATIEAGPGGPQPEPVAKGMAAPTRCICGFANAAEARFCRKCGAAIAAAPSDTFAQPGVSQTEVAVSPRAPRAGMHRPSPILVGIIVAVSLIAVGGYWWMSRPPGSYKTDNSGLYPINVNGKYGFMDRSGKTLITPQFDLAYGFGEGLAAVRVGTKWGYVNTKGIVAITPQFDDAGWFRYGRAIVKLCCGWGTQNSNDRYGIIDTDGKFVRTPDFPLGRTIFSGDFAPVRLRTAGLLS